MRQVSNRGGGLSILSALALLSAPAGAHAFDAEIRWTRYGVPHVKASDYAGLGYGYGYAVAGHHLCLLAERVWTLRGERSRWFGAGGTALTGFAEIPNLDSDLFYRVQLTDEDVESASRQLSPDAKDLARGYAAGYNRYVRDLAPEIRSAACKGTPLPAMQSSDVVRATMQIGTIWKAGDVAAMASQSTWENLISPQPSPAPSSARRAAIPARSFRTGMASNAWAYGSDVTGTGAAIVVANPHTIWQRHWLLMHQMHLTIPGEIDVVGADFIGLPVPLAGYTRHIAWSVEAPLTVTYHLLLALQMNAAPKPAYTVDGRSRELTFRTVELDIRQDDGSVQRRAFRIPYSHLGAIYKLEAAEARPAGWYAITDANVRNARGLDQMLAVAKARDIGEFERAVAGNRGLTAHLIAGDRHGKAMYIESGPLLDIDDDRLMGCFAVKRDGRDGERAGPLNVLDGTRSDCAVRTPGLAPKLAAAGKIPALETRGIVHNANDSYRFSIFGESRGGYSLLFGDPLAPLGARTLMSQRHIREILEDKRVTVQEATEVMFSNRNYAAETSLDGVLAACEAAAESSAAARACSILAAWDRRNDSGSRGALLFHEAWPRLQQVEGLYEGSFDAADPFRVLSISRAPSVAAGILRALEESMQALGKLGLRGDEPWGSMLARAGAGGRQPLHGGGGDQGVLNAVSGYPLQPDGFEQIVDGSSYIHVVTWDKDRPVAGVMLVHGQSGDPASVHYSDQVPLFQRKRLAAMPFTDAEIAADPELKVIRVRE